jgi:peptidylprolyl isomerase/peptidyl-prolyl cis-trans isomerase B (cyclophilin B)
LAPEPTATPVQVSQAASQAQDAGKVPPPESINSGPASALALDARNGMYDAPPAMEIDANQYYYATLKTDRGNIKVQLFADRAPITVNNFVFLARQGYYDNTMFHRVLDGFMAQAGDPTGTGSGGPGYEFEDEIYPGLVFDRSGLLAMANRGPATNGSQFFITFAPTEWLNGGHTIFGEVIEGADVLNKITRRDPVQTPNFPGDTIYTIVIEEANTSVLPTPSPSPPTPTPTPTPTPFAPSSLDSSDRPLAKIPAAERANYFNVPPEMALDAGKRYVATITTSRGELVVNLHDDQAPLAVNNFVLLANLGFYDDTPVALVRPDDSIIIGAPDNNPLNDAGYKFAAEVGADIEMEIGAIAYIPFDRLPDGAILSSSSQLLIALIKPPPAFNANFSFFGQIVEGLEVLKQLTTEDGIKTIAIEVAEE